MVMRDFDMFLLPFSRVFKGWHFPVASQPFFYLVCFEVYLALIG